MTKVLGVEIKDDASYWDGDRPSLGLWKEMQEGKFAWSRNSDVARDVMLQFRLASGHSIADLYIIRRAMKGHGDIPDYTEIVGWNSSVEGIVERLQRLGTYYRPRYGANTDIEIEVEEIYGGSKITVSMIATTESGRHYRRVDEYEAMRVGESEERRWTGFHREQTVRALAKGREMVNSPAVSMFLDPSLKGCMSMLGYRAAILFGMIEPE